MVPKLDARKRRLVLACAGSAVLIALSGAVLTSAQTSDPRLAAIRALSADIEARIATANKEAEGMSPGGFYCTETWINSRNGSWRAVGNYYQKIQFWHTDEPGFAAAEGLPEKAVLVKAEVHEAAAIRTYYRDFLFDDGRLVFVYIKERSGDGPFEERRYYFDKGKLFRFQLGTEVKAEVPDAAAILREAESLQARFLALFR
ncbi:MAG: hypothetical protein PHI34_10080 [Acidobacteriota bacterium]|nr:hypothetical protein [Acidobacteriota bacterium]